MESHFVKDGIFVPARSTRRTKRAEIVIININSYESTNQLVRQPAIGSALRGKVLVQLSSGTPDEAREMESWARPRGIDYLDGAIMNYPVDIGKPQGTVLYSDPEELFNRVKPVLLAFGDNAMFVGKEIGQASATDVAGLSFVMGAMLGFLHGYIVYEAENLPVDGYLQVVKKFMPAIEAALADLCEKIQGKDYGTRKPRFKLRQEASGPMQGGSLASRSFQIRLKWWEVLFYPG